MAATRKLLTIFYADVAGYSRLTGDDEMGARMRALLSKAGVPKQADQESRVFF